VASAARDDDHAAVALEDPDGGDGHLVAWEMVRDDEMR
jgi:hypothetical protein